MRVSQNPRAAWTEDYAPANPSYGRECGGTGSVTPAAPQSRWSPDTDGVCPRNTRSPGGRFQWRGVAKSKRRPGPAHGCGGAAEKAGSAKRARAEQLARRKARKARSRLPTGKTRTVR